MNRRALATLLFSVYFLLYAVSPLTYAVDEKKTGEGRLESSDSATSVRGPHYFLWELITERPSARNSAGSHNAAGTPILIKKKRAVVPEDDPIRLSLHAPAVPVSRTVLPARHVPVRYIITVSPNDSHNGFSPLYAGHAPPVI